MHVLILQIYRSKYRLMNTEINTGYISRIDLHHNGHYRLIYRTIPAVQTIRIINKQIDTVRAAGEGRVVRHECTA